MTLDPLAVRQAAVLAVRAGRICLVSSSSGRRWTLPKGCVEPGQTAAETALQELWEEAGLVGVLDRDPVGSYVYEKVGRSHHVVVFLLHVTNVTRTWPECHRRQRRWVSPAKALRYLDQPGLRRLLRRVLADQAMGQLV